MLFCYSRDQRRVVAKLKALKVEKETADSLVTYPRWKSQSETLENYMDYHQSL
ncbi:MAG: hypothetical protein QM535_04820 [Limnohabitans sp.]|nr:hypothetical protein [Limnohabitans sp.]